MIFSERMGFVPERKVQIKTMDNCLCNRLYNYYCRTSDIGFINSGELCKYILDKMGVSIDYSEKTTFVFLENKFGHNDSTLKDLFMKKQMWYVPYDIIEYLIEFITQRYFSEDDDCDEEDEEDEEDDEDDEDGTNDWYNDIINELNTILIEEKSGYRMIDGKFVPITNEMELKEIQSSMHSTFDPVNEHIKKALNLYSDRENPDYENSIKESISAVESMCCIITGLTGANATLGAAIKKLKDSGVHIHGAMENAFSALYGYASDENGIRHGGISFVNAPEEDARYMLVSCSAFVNYLKDKYLKSQNGGNP